MKKILFIEDNTEIRENISEILALAGYNVLTADNGKAGVSIAIAELPNLIICDIMMPELDGYGVIHMLHRNATTKSIPFIFLTAKAERAEIRKGMDLGADDYITKPFSGTELLSAIESRFRKTDLLRQELAPGITGLDTLMRTAGKSSLKTLIEDHSTYEYKKKQIIYTEGSNPHRLFYIQTGKVKTYKTNDDGKDLVINLYNEGDFFGYLALLEGDTYKETAQAIEDSELSLIPRQDFEQLINYDRDIMQKFIQLLANNISEKEKLLLDLAYNSLRKRVANGLLILYNKYKTEATGNAVIDMTRENLANIVGTTKESLIRTLSDFKDEKLIEINNGIITILQEKKLANLQN
ncbi:MAG: response regulator [Bacteroidetes bacterium]|nr:response regulator [Bacteroidota bacterium]